MSDPTETVNDFKAEIAKLKALRCADERFERERDRRYAEVKAEQEKALKIKETADLAALTLARENQSLKDSKVSELEDRINSERNLYATKMDLAAGIATVEALIKPLTAANQSYSGGRLYAGEIWTRAIAVASLVAVVMTFVVGKLG